MPHHPTRAPSRCSTMPNRLRAEIERVRSDPSIPTLDEDNVKRVAIEPILGELGWNIYDTNEFRSENKLSGGKVDYSLRLENKTKVFLEAKNPREELGKHQRQLLEYAFEKGVPLAVLTNGLNWWFYLPLQEGNWEERRFSVIELRNPDVSQTADLLVDFLSRENVRSGVAVAYAESLLDSLWKDKKIEEALPRAWNQLITDPHDQLLALLNQKVKELCGWGAHLDQIKRFLANLPKPTSGQSIPTPFPTPPIPAIHPQSSVPRQQTRRGQQFTGKKLRQFIFKSNSYTCNSYTGMLVTLTEEMFRLHSTGFARVLERNGGKGPYFSRDPNDLRQGKPIVDSGYFVETNLNTMQRIDISDELLAKFGYTQQDLVIETT